ncbi:putative transcriptional regulatory protein [Venturia nashicola]|uniref:Putative transcriptional regulatory protein n=1 Tax=Venturia nashicola TaxID=86259 RepID=A0A4Z1PBX9_9PEZI|nr:putative transcriptional regulatory protein [Venturia nashicola]
MLQVVPSRSLLRFLRQSATQRSKIKHDKAVKDGRMAKHRVLLAQDIVLAVKLYGPDPAANPRLRTAIEKAKAAKYPKDSIENAIRRGQGISSSGKPLENITIEAVLPAGVAAIVECQTESKLRTLTEVRAVITKGGGQQSPTQYMFDRRGKIVFKLGDVSPDTLMETALDLDGFIDIEGPEEGEETEDARASVLTEPSATKAVADAITEKLGIEISSLGIEWQPSDVVELKEDDPSYDQIQEIIYKLEDINEVQDVYVNI